MYEARVIGKVITQAEEMRYVSDAERAYGCCS